jgi:hypothetical protein
MNKEQQKELLKEIMEADARDGLYHNVYTNKMVTAVEWLFTQLYEKFEMKGDGEKMNKILNKAIEMEKEQIIQAHNYGEYFSQFRDCLDDEHGKQYYDQTYTNSINNSK